MLKNLTLSTKLNLLLLLIFVGVVAASGLVLSEVLGKNAEKTVASQALTLIETMSAVREYTDTEVNPELAPRLETDEWFLPQTVPAYSAREVFENLRRRDQYGNFFYKEATLNPTNPRDRADEFEAALVENFRNTADLGEMQGFRTLPSGQLFYVARPLAVTEESCLRCHSTPEAAPASQIATYGNENGFGWELGEIVGAQIISVPASAVLAQARNLQLVVIGILGGFFLIAMLILNLFLKFAIAKPLKKMAHLSKQVSTGNMAGEFKHDANDEIGILAASLNRMKVSLEMAMNLLNSEASER